MVRRGGERGISFGPSPYCLSVPMQVIFTHSIETEEQLNETEEQLNKTEEQLNKTDDQPETQVPVKP